MESLLPTGAAVHIVAPEAVPEIRALAGESRLTWTQREYQHSDLNGVFIVVAATATVNRAVHEEATRRGILCNAVDDPPFCDFYFGSIVRRGNLQIAISTNGDSPALSQRLRREIDAQLPDDLWPWLANVGSLRREVLATHPPGEDRKRLLHTLAQRSLCEAESCPTRLIALAERTPHPTPTGAVAAATFAQNDSLPESSKRGNVYLVGAGPGDPDLLTVKAARLLAAAEVVLHDDLVAPEIVALVNPKAWVLNVGKRCGAKSVTQHEINCLMIDFARRGLDVVRMKSGDPLIFGRAGEEMDALHFAGIDFEVVPGITAAFAAAASLQCSLTDRRAASKVVFSTGHHAQSTVDGSRPEGHETRIVYMPGRDLRSLANEWLSEGLPPDLPCIMVSRAALPGQQSVRTTLADLRDVRPGVAPNLLLAGFALSAVDSYVTERQERCAADDAMALT